MTTWIVWRALLELKRRLKGLHRVQKACYQYSYDPNQALRNVLSTSWAKTTSRSVKLLMILMVAPSTYLPPKGRPLASP